MVSVLGVVSEFESWCVPKVEVLERKAPATYKEPSFVIASEEAQSLSGPPAVAIQAQLFPDHLATNMSLVFPLS